MSAARLPDSANARAIRSPPVMERGRYRRAFVIAALATLGVYFLVRAGFELIDDTPDTRGARLVRFTVDSRLVDRELRQVGITHGRPGDAPRPLLVLLHGRTDDDEGPDSLLSDELLGALERLGPAAPAVLLVNGGEASYFHDRDDGRWASYVLREAIPAGLRRLRADPKRIAIGGISMGGFGALHLASRQTFCAVGGHSPALWRAAGETPEGAFDDAADFARTTPFARAPTADDVWLDVGDDDPFRAATVALGEQMGERVRVWPGKHEGAYWRSHMGAYLDFYAGALERC